MRKPIPLPVTVALGLVGWVRAGMGALWLAIGMILLAGAWGLGIALYTRIAAENAATQSVEAHLVDRYWRATLPQHDEQRAAETGWQRRYDLQTIAVVQYSAGETQHRVQYADPRGAHEAWQWPPPRSPFDRPLPQADFALAFAPADLAALRAGPKETWDGLVADLDDPVLATVEAWSHPAATTMALRLDPAHPDTPLLPDVGPAQLPPHFFGWLATGGCSFFGLVLTAVGATLILGRRHGWMLWLAVVLSLPLWSAQLPTALRWLKPDVAQALDGPLRELSANGVLGQSIAETPDSSLVVVRYGGANSMYAEIWPSLAPTRPAACCNDNVAAYRALSAQVSQRLLTLDAASQQRVLVVLGELGDAKHTRLSAPLIPVLATLSRNELAPETLRNAAVRVLRQAVDYPNLPQDLEAVWLEQIAPLENHPDTTIAGHVRSHLEFAQRTRRK